MSPVLRLSLLGLLAVALLIAGIQLALPKARLPAQAFAMLDDASLVVVAEPGDGFYGLETSAKSRWSWSGGEAVMVLRRAGRDAAPRTLRLQMLIHSIAPRVVTIRHGDFILWRGPVEARRTPVEIPLFTFTGPKVELVFSSDRPGELRADGGDPRPLAFALYDLEITRAD
ncbi:MAG: hypothetical protein KIT44_04785 [Opitutaceae bacterium]|nr:hypothetical protein [Opitutaceae bacterium]